MWNLYVQDFLSNKFILDPNYKLLPKDVEILKHKVDSSPKTAPVDRFFKLHIQIAVNRLKLTQALPTLRRLHELSSSYGMEAATAKSHFSSDVIIKMLFDYLKDFIDKENSEDKLLSWYDLFIEIVSSDSEILIVINSFHSFIIIRHCLKTFSILMHKKDGIWQQSCGYAI